MATPAVSISSIKKVKRALVKMEQNIFYLQTKLIIETIIKTAVDVIGTRKEGHTTREANVQRKVRLTTLRFTL